MNNKGNKDTQKLVANPFEHLTDKEFIALSKRFHSMDMDQGVQFLMDQPTFKIQKILSIAEQRTINKKVYNIGFTYSTIEQVQEVCSIFIEKESKTLTEQKIKSFLKRVAKCTKSELERFKKKELEENILFLPTLREFRQGYEAEVLKRSYSILGFHPVINNELVSYYFDKALYYIWGVAAARMEIFINDYFNGEQPDTLNQPTRLALNFYFSFLEEHVEEFIITRQNIGEKLKEIPAKYDPVAFFRNYQAEIDLGMYFTHDKARAALIRGAHKKDHDIKEFRVSIGLLIDKGFSEIAKLAEEEVKRF